MIIKTIINFRSDIIMTLSLAFVTENLVKTIFIELKDRISNKYPQDETSFLIDYFEKNYHKMTNEMCDKYEWNAF